MRRTAVPAPPTGWRRLAFRLPIHLYRAHLGWLLGGRFVLLTHTGRTSGRERQVVLEVVDRDPSTGQVLLASGYGPRADWYRNVLAHPQVRFQVGRRSRAALAHPVPTDEGADLMARYAGAHRTAARSLCGFMGFEVDGGVEDFHEVGRHIPFVRLEPR